MRGEREKERETVKTRTAMTRAIIYSYLHRASCRVDFVSIHVKEYRRDASSFVSKKSARFAFLIIIIISQKRKFVATLIPIVVHRPFASIFYHAAPLVLIVVSSSSRHRELRRIHNHRVTVTSLANQPCMHSFSRDPLVLLFLRVITISSAAAAASFAAFSGPESLGE